MPQRTATKSPAESSAKIIVFGVDDDCKPHAAWFAKNQAEPARTIAKQLRLNAIEVVNGTAADLVAKLPAGRIHANGPGAVPPVREDLYEKLVAGINSRGEAGREKGEAIATDAPVTWNTIKAGHLVLAQDSLVEGWWAAVVTERVGNKLTLRWRDYPGWPKFSLPVTAVALINPAAN